MYLAYTRVSSLDQARPDRVSLTEQAERCRAVASMNRIPAKEVAVYTDEGVSGGTPLYRRPAGKAMLAAAKSGDVIVASKLDRIFRSANDALGSIERLRHKGIDIVICDIGFEPIGKSAAARMFFGMMSLVAEFERERINERTQEGREGKKARGGHIGGDAPFGFKKLGSGRDAVLVPDDIEQLHIARALEYRGPNPKKWRMRMWDIAHEMWKDGMTNPRTGKAYTIGAIWRMLQAPVRQYGGQNRIVDVARIEREMQLHG